MGQLLYPQDINAVAILQKLVDIGVDSVKIEGRFRDAQTTARIVGEFRNAIDKISSDAVDEEQHYAGWLSGAIPVKSMFHKLNPRLKYKKPIFATELTPLNDGATITFKFDERTLKKIELLDNLGRQYLFPCSACNPIEMTVSEAVKVLKSKLHFKILEIASNTEASSMVLVDPIELLTVSKSLNQKCEGKLIAKPLPSKLPVPTVDDFMQLDSSLDMKYLKDVGYRNFIFDITSPEEANAALNLEGSVGTIIYRLPLLDFNGRFENVLLKLKGKPVMITRMSQLMYRELFSTVLADYTLNIWNSEALGVLKEFGVESFTANPELSFDDNKKIADAVRLPMNMISVGRIPLGYTRACFGEINLCDGNCGASSFELKNITKGYSLRVACNNAFGCRTILPLSIGMTSVAGDCRRRFILSQLNREERRLILSGRLDEVSRISSIYGRSVL